jgi:hypothetical protein
MSKQTEHAGFLDIRSQMLLAASLAVALPHTTKQQCLYFLPLPQGQSSLRPGFGTAAL